MICVIVSFQNQYRLDGDPLPNHSGLAEAQEAVGLVSSHLIGCLSTNPCPAHIKKQHSGFHRVLN
jgi:hypothetical protein